MSLQQLQQQNVVAPAAFNEYSVKLPPRVNQVTFQLRLGDILNWYTSPSANAPANSGNIANLPAVYGTIPSGASRTIAGQLGGQTVYFQVQTSQPGQVLEVDYYGDA